MPGTAPTKGALLTFGDDTWKRSLDALLHHRETDLFSGTG